MLQAKCQLRPREEGSERRVESEERGALGQHLGIWAVQEAVKKATEASLQEL